MHGTTFLAFSFKVVCLVLFWMKALILVGGYGTRLRPLTLTLAKPLVPFCNLPILVHQMIALRDAGVTVIILALSYQSDEIEKTIGVWSERLNVQIIFSVEKYPMGTAGPLALAKFHGFLCTDGKEPIFVLNSDVICKFPLREMLSFHYNRKAEATILVKRVENWNQYGVVVNEPGSGKVKRFVEKPTEFVGNEINAGIYLLQGGVVDRIPIKNTSIERETFPEIAREGRLYSFPLAGFWMDIGKPTDYLCGMKMYLDYVQNETQNVGHITEHCEPLSRVRSSQKDPYTIIPPCFIDSSVSIGEDSVIGPYVTIAAGCNIGKGVRIESSAIFRNAHIGDCSYVSSSIIGWENNVGRWCRLVSGCVFAADVTVKDELYLNGCVILPHKCVAQSVSEPQILM